MKKIKILFIHYLTIKKIFGQDNNIINNDKNYLNVHNDENSDEEKIENVCQ